MITFVAPKICEKLDLLLKKLIFICKSTNSNNFLFYFGKLGKLDFIDPFKTLIFGYKFCYSHYFLWMHFNAKKDTTDFV